MYFVGRGNQGGRQRCTIIGGKVIQAHQVSFEGGGGASGTGYQMQNTIHVFPARHIQFVLRLKDILLKTIQGSFGEHRLSCRSPIVHDSGHLPFIGRGGRVYRLPGAGKGHPKGQEQKEQILAYLTVFRHSQDLL